MGLGEGSHCDEKVDRLGRWKQGPAVRKCTEWASAQVSIRQAHQSQPWNRQYRRNLKLNLKHTGMQHQHCIIGIIFFILMIISDQPSST